MNDRAYRRFQYSYVVSMSLRSGSIAPLTFLLEYSSERHCLFGGQSLLVTGEIVHITVITYKSRGLAARINTGLPILDLLQTFRQCAGNSLTR